MSRMTRRTLPAAALAAGCALALVGAVTGSPASAATRPSGPAALPGAGHLHQLSYQPQQHAAPALAAVTTSVTKWS